VHSSLSSSPPTRGRPTCRVREPARAASRGDPIEGELSRPRSLANGTEPHLANPREHFYGRVSGPRANPYRTGEGRPLEPLDSSSMRNPQSATRSMGVVETSPSAPRRDDEGAFETRRRAHPDRLERAQARGIDARLHLLECTEREKYQSGVRNRSRLEQRRCRLKHMPRTLVKTREKNPAGALTLLQGFGG
jgi:ribosome modulation factor